MYTETVACGAQGTKELQLRVRPGVTACVARLIVRVVHCKFLFFGRRMLSRRSDIVVPTVGLRASGNLPVSYVLTGNLPVIYHVYFLVISKYIGGDTGAKP